MKIKKTNKVVMNAIRAGLLLLSAGFMANAQAVPAQQINMKNGATSQTLALFQNLLWWLCLQLVC